MILPAPATAATGTGEASDITVQRAARSISGSAIPITGVSIEFLRGPVADSIAPGEVNRGAGNAACSLFRRPGTVHGGWDAGDQVIVACQALADSDSLS